MVILYVCTGTKYSQWWVENLKYMLRHHVHLKFQGITEGNGDVFDKLLLFKYFKDKEHYLYFDLDVVIKGYIYSLFRKHFTLLNAWWRHEAHTPLNSSIMAWYGDRSYIYNRFHKQEDYYRLIYNRGIDEYLFKHSSYRTYNKVCWSWQFNNKELNYPVCLFNQSYSHMLQEEWPRKYLLSEQEQNTIKT